MEQYLNLDFQTVLVMLVVQTTLLSALLGYAYLHADGIRGLGYWASGSFCIALGTLGILVFYDAPVWTKVIGTSFIGLGIGLYNTGIRAFTELPTSLRFPIYFMLVIGAVDFVLLYFGQNVKATVIANGFMYLYGYTVTAILLLKQKPSTSSGTYWFTAILFICMAVLMSVRVIGAATAPSQVFDEMSQWPVNKFTFFVGSVFQLCIAFGFILMMSHRLTTRIKELAATDWLTNTKNRRTFEELAAKMAADCQRNGFFFTALMIDLDNFKLINDQFGHQAGDDVLRVFADKTQAIIRHEDIFGRYGGEEFCILLPNTPKDDAWNLAERIREVIAGTSIYSGKSEIKVTVSIGISSSESVNDLVKTLANADDALYQAKHLGRNVSVWHLENNFASI
jgi:diguanylate cyclase